MLNDNCKKYLNEMMIIIIDDEEESCNNIKKILENANVKLAMSINDIYSVINLLYNNSHFHLVICNMDMGSNKGFEIIRYIRAGFAGINAVNLPIIGITSSDSKDTITQCFRARVDAVVTSTVNENMLINIISNVTNQ